MALELFDFPYHTFSTENPESGFRGQMGNSYVFTSAPTDPDQRKFVLAFPTMSFFLDADGIVSSTIKPQQNIYTLILFYQRHKLHKSFQYNHPLYGLLEVKFQKPLIEPAGIPGGNGVVNPFTIELIEIP